MTAIALASIAAGAINAAAGATVGRSNGENLAFFVAVAALQLVWATVALTRVSRGLLALGAVGNAVVVATWVISRTVGLPAGVDAGIILPVRFPDGLATALEIVIVIGSASLLARGRRLARPAGRSPRVTVAAGVVLGALSLGGVLGQAGVIGSSTTGSGGGVNSPAAPGGGGGSSGGTTYGGGSSGGGSTGGSTSGGGSYGY